MQLNELVFGNPNRQHLHYLQSKNYLDSLLNELSSYPPPSNESETTTNELKELVGQTETLNQDQKLFRKFMLYDSNFEAYILKRLVDAGLPEPEIKSLLMEIHKDIMPLIIKLKFTFNRPRPQQLAYYKQIPLHVWRSSASDSPSYPAGHTFQAKIYAEVVGNRYPKYYKALNELAIDIQNSRCALGVHYPSDNEFSLYVAEVVLKHPDFVKKFKL